MVALHSASCSRVQGEDPCNPPPPPASPQKTVEPNEATVSVTNRRRGKTAGVGSGSIVCTSIMFPSQLRYLFFLHCFVNTWNLSTFPMTKKMLLLCLQSSWRTSQRGYCNRYGHQTARLGTCCSSRLRVEDLPSVLDLWTAPTLMLYICLVDLLDLCEFLLPDLVA